MITLPDQISAARNQQLEASLHMFQTISSQAVAATGKLMALNLQTARASLEHSTEAMRQVLGAEDPRDLLALTTSTQAGFDSCLAYGRALFSIASGFQPVIARSLPVAQPAAASVPAALDLPDENAPVVAQPEAPATEALAPLPVPEQAAAVKAKPLAKAVSKATPRTVNARRAAAPVAAAEAKPVKVTGLKAVEAAKPPPESPQLDMLAAKPKKKK